MFGLRKRFRTRKLFGKEYIPLERRKTRMMIFILVWGIIFTWLIKTFVISLEVIKGASMSPTFQRGDFYLVNKFVYNFTEPKRGDVVIIKDMWSKKKEKLIKRIIGIPGDIMEIKDGNVYLNGELLDEPYVEYETYPNMEAFKVKENMYFVMGDNREHSYDSRYFGLVERDRIRGKLAPDKLFTFIG